MLGMHDDNDIPGVSLKCGIFLTQILRIHGFMVNSFFKLRLRTSRRYKDLDPKRELSRTHCM